MGVPPPPARGERLSKVPGVEHDSRRAGVSRVLLLGLTLLGVAAGQSKAQRKNFML